MTSNDIKQKYIDKLGPKFGEMLHAVEDEWSYALDRYLELMTLFGKDKKRVALLNALGPAFVHDIQVVLSNDLILGLTRLTDTDKRSVSACHLPELIRDNPKLKKEVQGHVSDAQEYARTARERRNVRIAHRDRDRERLDGPVTYKDIKDGLDSVHAALQAVQMGYWNAALPNEVISRQMRTAGFAVLLESLVESVLYIESRIDPTGEAKLSDDRVAEAFLNRIRGDSGKDRVKIRRLRMAAKTIKERLDSQQQDNPGHTS